METNFGDALKLEPEAGGRRFGYRRVSSLGQNLDRQTFPHGVIVYQDKISGASSLREGWATLMESLAAGDVVLVHSIDRLSRDFDIGRAMVKQVLAEDCTIGFIGEGLFFTPCAGLEGVGGMIFNTLQWVAQRQREMLKENQRQGIEAARQRGAYRSHARAPAVSDPLAIVQQVENYGVSPSEAARKAGVSRATVYNYLKKHRAGQLENWVENANRKRQDQKRRRT